jgi:ATP-binding cassette subfamily B protein
MARPTVTSAKGTASKPGIFSLLKPYSGIVTLMIIMSLLGSGINMLIPKIIAGGIDSFSAGHFDRELIIYRFTGATAAIFIFTFLQNIIQTFASERVARDLGPSSQVRFQGRVTPMF